MHFDIMNYALTCPLSLSLSLSLLPLLFCPSILFTLYCTILQNSSVFSPPTIALNHPIPFHPLSSFVPLGGGSETYYPLSDLIFNLMFEDEEDATEFLTHCGFAVTKIEIIAYVGLYRGFFCVCLFLPHAD